MKYFIDLDNTICYTTNGNYNESIPIIERIKYVNKLKEDGNHITIWTARGGNTNIDYSDLTKKQLNEWNIQYDELLMNKPNYDIYIDDKSFNVDTYWRIPKLDDIEEHKISIRISSDDDAASNDLLTIEAGIMPLYSRSKISSTN